MIHVAILMKTYLDLIVRGDKTIESRLTKTNRPPYGVIEPGERIYFKQSAGPFRATAVVDHVLCIDDLTPGRVRDLKRAYNEGICGEDEFWEWKRDAYFATLIWLRKVEPIEYGPAVNPQRGIAWLLLDDHQDVYPDCLVDPTAQSLPFDNIDPEGEHIGVIRLPLSAGNIRNSHVSVRPARRRFPRWAFGGPKKADQARRLLTLELENGPVIQTDIVDSKNMFRARGPWREWLAQCGAVGGDELLLFSIGAGRYLVRFAPGTANVRQAKRVTERKG